MHHVCVSYDPPTDTFIYTGMTHLHRPHSTLAILSTRAAADMTTCGDIIPARAMRVSLAPDEDVVVVGIEQLQCVSGCVTCCSVYV